jgi:hypothetical protein
MRKCTWKIWRVKAVGMAVFYCLGRLDFLHQVLNFIHPDHVCNLIPVAVKLNLGIVAE